MCDAQLHAFFIAKYLESVCTQHISLGNTNMPLHVYDAVTADKLSWAAFACNVGLHFTQAPLMRVMLKDEEAASLERYVSYPALLQVAACSAWLLYGLFVFPSNALVANNSIGVAVGLGYCLCFLVKRPTLRGKCMVALLALLGMAGALILYGTLYFGPTAPSSPLSRDSRDALSSALTITITACFWASPLEALRAAALDLDDKRVPVALTLCMKATVTLWMVVGILAGDISLIVCSVIGLFCTTLQLGVLAYIRMKKAAALVEESKPLEGLEVRDAASEHK